MTPLRRCLIIVATLCLLSGCGFHLRGQHVFPPILHCLQLESATPFGDFESTLRRILLRLGINIQRERQAPVILHIINTRLFSDVPTIGGSNQARVYVFYYQVNFEVLDARRNVILPAKCVRASETLIVNAGTALEATRQLEILEQHMYEKATHMMINILRTIPAQ